MKRILLLLILFSSFGATAQEIPKLGSPFANTLEAPYAIKALGIPYGPDTTLNGKPDILGMLFWRTTDNTLWIRAEDESGRKWIRQQTLGVSTDPPQSALSASYNGQSGPVVYIEKTVDPSVDVTLNWASTRQLYGSTLSSIIVNDISQSFVDPGPDGTATGSMTVTLIPNTDGYFTNVTTASDGQISIASANVLFRNKWFYGFQSSSEFSSTSLRNLSNFFSDSKIADGRTMDLSDISGRQYAVLAFDAGLDTNNRVRIESEGADQTAKFNRTIESFTNSSGYTTNYIVYTGITTSGSNFSITLSLEDNMAFDSTSPPPSPEFFRIGVNEPEQDNVGKIMYQTPAKWSMYDTFFRDYKVYYWRFPGGTNGRWYSWMDSIPSQHIQRMASNRLADYYIAVQRAQTAATFRNQPVSTYGDEFGDMLAYCSAAHLKPVVQLNTVLYQQGDTVYFVGLLKGKGNGPPVNMGLRSDRWDTITANLIREISYAHSIIGQDSVMYWEIGNEDYSIMDGTEYADIVIRFTNIVKSIYPNDKVLWFLSKGDLIAEAKDQWNLDLLAYLNQNNFMSRIDYMVVHYSYPKNKQSCLNQDSLNFMVRDSYFLSDYMQSVKSYFAPDSVPKIWLTEISTIQNSNEDSNFNKQFAALLFFDLMLKAHAEKNVIGYNNHTGTGNKNGMFFDESILDDPDLSYVNQSIHQSEAFWYLSPRAYTYKIYHDSLGAETKGYVINSNYESLVTQEGNTLYIKVLNYNESSRSYDVSPFQSTASYVTYQFDDLTNHYWDPYSNKTSGTTSSTFTLPPHSITTIVINL